MQNTTTNSNDLPESNRLYYVDNLKKLSQSDNEFSLLEYQLRLALGSFSAHILRAFAFPEDDYDKTRATMVDNWMDCRQMREPNSRELVCERGYFEMPESGGILIHTGRFSVDSDDLSADNTFVVLHCEVDVSSSYCVYEGAHTVVPRHKTCLHILPSQLQNSKDEEQISNPQEKDFSHSYIVLDPSRIRPRHLVMFDMSSRTSNNPSPTSPFIQNAVEQAQSELQRQESEDNPQAFSQASNQLQSIENQREQILNNARDAERQIKEQFSEALADLHDKVQLKLGTLLSTEAELRRRVDEMKWLQSFISGEGPTEAPLTFLDAFEHHARLRSDKMAHMTGEEEGGGEGSGRGVTGSTMGDVRVEGSLKVISESATEEDGVVQQIPMLGLRGGDEEGMLETGEGEYGTGERRIGGGGEAVDCTIS